MATLGGLLFVGGDFGLRIYDTSSLALLTTIAAGRCGPWRPSRPPPA